MDQQDVSVNELASCVEVSPKTVYAWLAGKDKPRPYRLRQIAYCLAADYDEMALSLVDSTRRTAGTMTRAEIEARIAELRAELEQFGEGE